MKKIIFAFLILLLSVSSALSKQEFLDSLNTIDPELRKYFPRWKVCEPDLQYQIYQAFQMLGFSQSQLDIQSVEVLASPKSAKDRSFEVLLLSCGSVSLNARELERELKTIVDYLAGNTRYNRFNKDWQRGDRDYCFINIPAETPVKEDQGAAIRDYLTPTNVNQALTLSLFDQTLKIGETGFWIQNRTGNDQVGYPYYLAGESKFVLKRPLYVNNDPRTNKNTPYLINAHLGGVYRTDLGIQNGDMFSWLPERNLNTDPGGKLIFGVDIHMPFHPEAGIHINVESPINRRFDMQIDPERFATTALRPDVDFHRNDPRNGDMNYQPTAIVPILQTTGQVTAFYNLWLNKRKAENYFRFDLGLSYAEVREYMYFKDLNEFPEMTFHEITTNATNINLYHPTEFADWLYAKVEYRNQAVFPFSVSMQYSNQIMLARAYMPLFGNWLLLEAKYATPLREARSYEVKNFFIISPVIRIAI
jgi:hypothetical protein